MKRRGTTSRLRQKLSLEQEMRTADGAGGYTRSWETVTELWAEVEPISGRERLMALQPESEVTHRLMLRFRNGITAGQRLSGDGRIFYIRYVTPVAKGDKLELLAEERAGI